MSDIVDITITVADSPTIEISSDGPQGGTGPAGEVTTAALQSALAAYCTASYVAANFQPLDSDLTAIAALTTTSTGRALLEESTAQTGTGALVRAASPTLTGTALATNITASGTLKFGSTCYRSDANTGLGTNASSNFFLALAGTSIIGSGNANELTVRQSTALGFSNTALNVVSGNDVTISRASAGVLQCGTTGANALGTLNLATLVASVALCTGVYTFATVPSASANTGKFIRISDRSQKHAYSDGTNWRFFDGSAIIS